MTKAQELRAKKVADAAKRSINPTLSHRGLSGLRRAGIDEAVLELAVPVRGRMIHDRAGNISLQQYDPDPQRVMHSVGRESINAWLLKQLEEHEATGRVELFFGYKCVKVHGDGKREALDHLGQTIRVGTFRFCSASKLLGEYRCGLAVQI